MLRLWPLAAVAALSACGTGEKSVPYMERPEVLAACGQSGIDVRQPLEANELFIAAPYLKYLAGSQNEHGHVQHPELSRVVRYALQKGLTALETDLRFEGQSNDLQERGRITRIGVMPAHSPACKAFRYPWWEMPELRKLGLDPDHCVGVETLAEPTAATRVLASASKGFRISTDRDWFALWRIDIEAGVMNAQQELQPVIRGVDHTAWFSGGGNWGYGGWAWGCADRDARAVKLNAAISGKGNPLLHPPQQVVMPDPEVPVEESELSVADMDRLRWLERERCAGGGHTYNAAGTVWIQDIMVGKELRIALHVLHGDHLLVAPMPRQFPRGVYWHHSALEFKGGYVVNLTRTFKNDQWRRLVVFDKDLKYVATWKLSAEQMEALVPSEPATINRCTDSKKDQFQRQPEGTAS